MISIPKGSTVPAPVSLSVCRLDSRVQEKSFRNVAALSPVLVLYLHFMYANPGSGSSRDERVVPPSPKHSLPIVAGSVLCATGATKGRGDFLAEDECTEETQLASDRIECVPVFVTSLTVWERDGQRFTLPLADDLGITSLFVLVENMIRWL